MFALVDTCLPKRILAIASTCTCRDCLQLYIITLLTGLLLLCHGAVLAPQELGEYCSNNASVQLPHLGGETPSARHAHTSYSSGEQEQHQHPYEFFEGPLVPQVCLPLPPIAPPLS